MKFKAILVGLGKIGFQYDRNVDNPEIILTHAKAISLNSDFDFIGGVDPSKENRNDFEKRYEIISFKTIKEFQPIVNLGLVVIATPTENHLEMLRMVIELNPKAILLEKPIAQNLDEARASLELVAKSNISIFCNYQRNTGETFLNLARQIANAKVRGPFTITAWFTGSFLNIGSHFISLFLLLFPEVDYGRYVGFFKNNTLTLQNNSVMIYLIRIPESKASVFEFSLMAENVKIDYNSSIGEINLHNLVENINYPNEYSYGSTGETFKTNEEKLLEKVYLEIANFLRGEPESLCNFKLAFRAQELINLSE